MKQYFSNIWNDIKKLWKLYLVKFAFMFAGLYLFTLGITIYVTTSVGASHMDFAIFSLIAVLHPDQFVENIAQQTGNSDLTYGSINPDGVQKYYPILLTWYFVGMMAMSFIFGLVATIREFKKTKQKTVWIKIFVTLLTDIIITFMLPQMINLHSLYVDQIAIGKLPQSVKGLVFLCAYVIYVFGVATWVYSGWLLGPYNSICDNFIYLTKMKYGISRILMDFLIIFPGFMITFAVGNSWEDKWAFFSTNINFGTVFFVIITGPTAQVIIEKVCKKIVVYDVLKEKLLNAPVKQKNKQLETNNNQ